MPLVRQVLLAQDHWRLKGLKSDVVILNEHPVSYRDELHEQLAQLVDGGPWAGWKGRPSGIFLLRGDAMPEAERVLLATVARVVLDGRSGELAQQMDLTEPEAFSPPPAPNLLSDDVTDDRLEPPPLVMPNGLGGFTRDGREYVVVLAGGKETPLPWSNVIANPGFGTLVTATGRGDDLVREQPGEPADAVRERPRDRSHGRGHLPAGRGERRAPGRDSGAAPADGARGRAG